MDGGAIPITKPLLGEEECQAVVEALRSGWLTQGNRVAAFEQAVADYVGAKHAIACSSCTTALHLALHVSGIGPGDEVIVPSMSFIASANSVRYVGATPVFAEVNPLTFNLDPDAVAEAIGARTRAILVVHQIGLAADLDRFRALADERGLLLIEDAACAIGSAHRGRRIGGDAKLACFSFHPRKVITTGEGGMITTCDAALAQRLRLLRQHAMSLSDQHRHASDKVLIEEYPEVGFNYRMTDLQAAIGVEQMKRLDGILARRRQLAERYTAMLARVPGVHPPFIPDYATPNYQSYAIRLADEFSPGRNELLQILLQQGIAARRGIMTSHREKAYQQQGRRLPITERASDQSLLLPLYPAMTEAEQDRVVAALARAREENHVARRVA